MSKSLTASKSEILRKSIWRYWTHTRTLTVSKCPSKSPSYSKSFSKSMSKSPSKRPSASKKFE